MANGSKKYAGRMLFLPDAGISAKVAWHFMMQLRPDTLENIHGRMAAIKSSAGAGGEFFTNYFRQELSGEQLLAFGTRQTLVFLNDDIDFFRLYFFTTSLDDLRGVLNGLEFNGTVVASYLEKQTDERILDLFRNSGFEYIALFKRMINNNLRACSTNDALQFAEPGDMESVYRGLLKFLNKHTDHFPTRRRLGELIAARQVLVNRREGEVQGCIIFRIQGKVVNFNYLYNFSANSLDALTLQMNFYGLMHERGIRSGFLWVNAANQGVIKMDQNFGWKFDGLRNHFLLKYFNQQYGEAHT